MSELGCRYAILPPTSDFRRNHMDINIYVNQKKINPLYQKAIAEYVKRLSPYCTLSIVCVAGKIKCTSGKNTTNYCISGSDTISSEDYAARINSLTSSGTSKINFYIGYDESLTADMENFSLCSVQPSAEMTALLLSEQTYRAYTILNNITYHK